MIKASKCPNETFPPKFFEMTLQIASPSPCSCGIHRFRKLAILKSVMIDVSYRTCKKDRLLGKQPCEQPAVLMETLQYLLACKVAIIEWANILSFFDMQ